MTGLVCFLFWFGCLSDFPGGVWFWTIVWILIYAGIKIWKEAKRMVVADQQREAYRRLLMSESERKKYDEEHKELYYISWNPNEKVNKESNNGKH